MVSEAEALRGNDAMFAGRRFTTSQANSCLNSDPVVGTAPAKMSVQNDVKI